jgi:hypothetical protein
MESQAVDFNYSEQTEDLPFLNDFLIGLNKVRTEWRANPDSKNDSGDDSAPPDEEGVQCAVKNV